MRYGTWDSRLLLRCLQDLAGQVQNKELDDWEWDFGRERLCHVSCPFIMVSNGRSFDAAFRGWPFLRQPMLHLLRLPLFLLSIMFLGRHRVSDDCGGWKSIIGFCSEGRH